jgi:two-component system, chemotaxis family, chemotaxis protein CheY
MSSKILIVDDSGLSRRTLRNILEPAGYAVLEAEDGIIALERYFVDRPELVMLDLTMEGLNGMEVLKQMRQIDPAANVVVASADIQTSTHAMAFEAGASGYVTKPFTADEVLETVDRILRGGGNATDRPTK